MAEERTLYITNLDEKVTKEILEELFTQVGPVETVSIISQATRYAFVQFADEESVPFSIKMMDGLRLYNTYLSVRPRANTEQDRKYREQGGYQRRSYNAAPRHHSSGHRREPSDDYNADYQPHNARRSTNESNTRIPQRYNQQQSQHPLHSFIGNVQDPYNDNTNRRNVPGGYYNQSHRSNSAGHRSSNNQQNGNQTWR